MKLLAPQIAKIPRIINMFFERSVVNALLDFLKQAGADFITLKEKSEFFAQNFQMGGSLLLKKLGNDLHQGRNPLAGLGK